MDLFFGLVLVTSGSTSQLNPPPPGFLQLEVTLPPGESSQPAPFPLPAALRGPQKYSKGNPGKAEPEQKRFWPNVPRTWELENLRKAAKRAFLRVGGFPSKVLVPTRWIWILSLCLDAGRVQPPARWTSHPLDPHPPEGGGPENLFVSSQHLPVDPRKPPRPWVLPWNTVRLPDQQPGSPPA